MAQESSSDEIKAFLEQLAGQAEITDFIQNLGRDLVASGVLRSEEFDKTPGMLQVAKLKTKLRDSKIYVGDIAAGAEWKDRKADWWDQHGAQLVIRIQKAWKTQAGGVGAVTDAVIRGQVLSKAEREEVVEDSLMAQLEAKLAAEDVAGCKTLLVSTSRFGALFQRGWINFKESGASEKEVIDNSLRRLNSAFLAYSRIWTGKVLPGIFREVYTRRQYYPPKFFGQLHEQLTAFASGKGFEEGLLGAMALMTERSSAKELGSCSAHTISKALAAAMKVYDAMLDDVGSAAGQHAQDVLEVWSDADPHWEVYSKYYDCKRHQEPLTCVKTFVVPVVRDWMSDYWSGILKTVGGRVTGADFKTLEKTLALDNLRNMPRLGVRIFEERASDVRITLAGSPKRSSSEAAGETPNSPAGGGGADEQGQPSSAKQQNVSRLRRPDLICDHCGKAGHQKSACWALYPHLDPKTPEGKLMRQQDKARTKADKARRTALGTAGAYGGWNPGGQFGPFPNAGYFPYTMGPPGAMMPPSTGGATGAGTQGDAAPGAGIPPPPPYPPGVMLPAPGLQAGPPGGGGQKLCYECGQPGHLARHCPGRGQGK
eukprot:COSAG06_NODE_1605_length_8948_cov_25.421939_5_plen_597_part_00